jgi:hypothetical protein
MYPVSLLYPCTAACGVCDNLRAFVHLPTGSHGSLLSLKRESMKYHNDIFRIQYATLSNIQKSKGHRKPLPMAFSIVLRRDGSFLAWATCDKLPLLLSLSALLRTPARYTTALAEVDQYSQEQRTFRARFAHSLVVVTVGTPPREEKDILGFVHSGYRAPVEASQRRAV